MSYSLYNIRKAVRSAQHALDADNTETLAIRNATTTESWGPSSDQLEAVYKETIRVGYDRIFYVIFKRIEEYEGRGKKPRKKTTTGSLYHMAIRYVNSGNEWRIVFKCLKVLEYLSLRLNFHDVVDALSTHRDSLDLVVERWSLIAEQKKPKIDDQGVQIETITTVDLQTSQQAEAVLKQAQRLVRLAEDEEFFIKESKTNLKLEANREGDGNGASFIKEEVPAYMKDFKTKNLDRGKIQNSNTKKEIRDHVGHIIHRKEKLPGVYQQTNQHGFTAESVLDDDSDAEYYDNEEVYISNAFRDVKFTDKEPKEDQTGGESEDEFGGFESATPRQEPLLSFEEPETPTGRTLDSIFTSQTLATEEPKRQ
ncbi:Epsin-5 [Cyberlindnera fabianii]|uniref:Epsin-5 n=1 Tax=Cyberlindnera fabianii TaxID=36022 RepID=A0A1V2LAZ9_CYBFA|nr:Epsin-5 [Cyberlindnera fabianii]